jgi:hypothetical protein
VASFSDGDCQWGWANQGPGSQGMGGGWAGSTREGLLDVKRSGCDMILEHLIGRVAPVMGKSFLYVPYVFGGCISIHAVHVPACESRQACEGLPKN